MQKNNSIEQEKGELNPYFERISQILKMDKGALITGEQKAGVKLTIDSILKENNKNKELAYYLITEVDPNYFIKLDSSLKADRKIAIAAMREKSSNFYHIDSKLKNDFQVGQEVLLTMIREGKNFLKIEGFLEKYFGENKPDFQKLLSFYEQNLSQSEIYLKDDLSKNLIVLKSLYPEIFDKLKSVKLFKQKASKVKISDDFIKNLLIKITKVENFENLDEKQKNDLKIKTILDTLGIGNFGNANITDFFLGSIIDLLNLELNKKFVKEKSRKQQEEQEGGEDDNKKDQSENRKEEIEPDFIEKSSFYLPEYDIQTTSGGAYSISLGNNQVEISKQEAEKFTSKALANYVKFYNTMNSLGLLFFWEKYRSGFQILAGNKSGFDYTSGEGITQNIMLSCLNMIGKNIGIPEKEIIGEDGKTLKEVKCFKTLADAKSAFGSIKETGKINGELYSDLGTFSRGAVENFLIENGKIDGKGGVNISNWK